MYNRTHAFRGERGKGSWIKSHIILSFSSFGNMYSDMHSYMAQCAKALDSQGSVITCYAKGNPRKSNCRKLCIILRFRPCSKCEGKESEVPKLCIALPFRRRAYGPKACGILSLGVGILTPIAMAIRVLPGAFGLELCRPNRCQATHENHQNHWFPTGFISVFARHRLTFLHWC